MANLEASMIDPSHLLPEEDPRIPLMPVQLKGGLLFRYDDTRVERLRCWPNPTAWVSEDGENWREHRPEVDLSAVDYRRRPFTYQGLSEASAWSAVPEEVVHGVIDAHLLRHQWASLTLFSKVPEALSLVAEVPLLAAALAVLDRIQQAPVEQPYVSIAKPFEVPRGMRRWRAVAAFLDLPSDRAFVKVLRRTTSLPSFPLGAEHVAALRDAWGSRWGRKLLCHAPGLDRSNIGLLMAAMRVGRLDELRPGLLADTYNDGDDSRVAFRFARFAKSWDVLYPKKSLPKMTSGLDLLIAQEDLRSDVAQRYKVDTGPRHPPSETFPPPPLPGAPGIEPLTSADELREEGQLMAHCLITSEREDSARRREGYGYKLSLPEGRATVWLIPDGKGGVRLDEVQGHLNRDVPPEVMDRVCAWLDGVGDQVAEEWKDAKTAWVEFESVPEELQWATGAMPF